MLSQRSVQRMRLSVKAVMLSACGVALIFVIVKVVIMGYFLKPEHVIASPSDAPTLSFKNSTLISGTAGNVNAVYLFANVTTGVDARVTLVQKYNGASLDHIDQPASSGGYTDAFQPIIDIASGSSGSPKTSYIEWRIQFKKAGTTTDTTFSTIAATALDVDGNSNLTEMVRAFDASSYSIDPFEGTDVSISMDSNSVTAVSPEITFTDIDSSNREVMFQINFTNVNAITYYTGGINNSSSSERQTSIYFKPFFSNFEPLPVSLTSFDATSFVSYVMCNWNTASEVNNDYFTLQRSKDGKTFTDLKNVDGNGTTTAMHSYSYKDVKPLTGTSYYRLLQTDFDGKTKILKTVGVNIRQPQLKQNVLTVSPNPFSETFTATFYASKQEEVQLMILSGNGIIVFRDKILTEEGMNTYRFSNYEVLTNGTYYLKVVNQDSSIPLAKLIKY